MSSSIQRILFCAARAALALLLLAVFVYPVFYVITSSFKTVDELAMAPYHLPSVIRLNNYATVFTTSNILIYFKNSLIILVVQVSALIVLSSMAAFALSKIDFKRRRFLISFFLLGLMLPTQVALIPLFFIFTRMNILNTYTAVILPQVAFSLSYSIHLFVSFYRFMPNDIIESSIIDGCSPMGSFVRIVVPVSMNAILTIATMQGVFCWNEFICAYTFTRSTAMKTVTLGLNDFVGFMGKKDWGATFAAITVTVLPTFIFYFLTSKYMISGLTAGAVKG